MDSVRLPFYSRMESASDLLRTASSMLKDLSERADQMSELATAKNIYYSPDVCAHKIDLNGGVLPTQMHRSILEIRSMLLRADKMIGGE